LNVLVLPVTKDDTDRLLALLKANEVKGPHVFDLPIVATMLAHGVNKIFTYNERDFRQFMVLEVMEPN
jgi:predicted nucleic acid-binding protein